MIDPSSNPAKTGKRDEPELTLFDSSSVDRLAQMLLVMASELHVLRDRVRCLEFMLANQGQVDLAALEHFQPSDEQASILARERDAFVAHLFEVIDGRAKSTSGRFPASGMREGQS
jgi:hypothetical protein